MSFGGSEVEKSSWGAFQPAPKLREAQISRIWPDFMDFGVRSWSSLAGAPRIWPEIAAKLVKIQELCPRSMYYLSGLCSEL